MLWIWKCVLNCSDLSWVMSCFARVVIPLFHDEVITCLIVRVLRWSNTAATIGSTMGCTSIISWMIPPILVGFKLVCLNTIELYTICVIQRLCLLSTWPNVMKFCFSRLSTKTSTWPFRTLITINNSSLPRPLGNCWNF